jgi:hypothetical protein
MAQEQEIDLNQEQFIKSLICAKSKFPVMCKKRFKKFVCVGKVFRLLQKTKKDTFELVKKYYEKQQPNNWKDEWTEDNLPNDIKFGGKTKKYFIYGYISCDNYDAFIKEYKRLHPTDYEEFVDQQIKCQSYKGLSQYNCEETLKDLDKLERLLLSDIPNNPFFEDFKNWLKTHPNYDTLPKETKNVIEEHFLNEKKNQKSNKNPVGFLKDKLNSMKQSKGVSEEISSYNQLRKFISCILVIQNGRSHYGQGFKNGDKIILQFTSGEINQWSCERLNESGDNNNYSVHNIVLNTLYFQSATNKPTECRYDIKKAIKKPQNTSDIVKDQVYCEKFNRLDFSAENLPEGCCKSGGRFVFGGKQVYVTKRTKEEAFEDIKNHFMEQRPDDWKEEYNINNRPDGINFIDGKTCKKYTYGQIIKTKYVDFIKEYERLHPNRYKEQKEQLERNKTRTDEDNYDYYCGSIKDGQLYFQKLYVLQNTGYMTTDKRKFKKHELKHSLADTIKGSAQWTLEKAKYFNDIEKCKEEDSPKRVEQINNMINELSEYIKSFDENKPNKLPDEGKTGIVYVFDMLINNCNENSRKRNMPIINKQELFNILYEQFKTQKMRCAYSNAKMSLNEMFHDFAMSVERKNEKEGYIKDNVLLVCKEFNTGYRQWSEELLNYYRGN